MMKVEEIDVGKRSAFSLMEMMTVLAVVGLLLAFAAPNLFSVITATSLSSEGTLLQNQLTLGQQLALAKSADVEVRFFKMTDLSAAQTEEEFRAYQLYQYSSDGELVPVSSYFRVRSPVAIHPGLSTLLATGSSASKEDKKFGYDSPRAGKAPAPSGIGGTLQDTDYISFRFRPDGGTDLPARAPQSDTWYITLVQGEGATQETDPDNFFCLQLNPHNGKISEFRP